MDRKKQEEGIVRFPHYGLWQTCQRKPKIVQITVLSLERMWLNGNHTQNIGEYSTESSSNNSRDNSVIVGKWSNAKVTNWTLMYTYTLKE